MKTIKQLLSELRTLGVKLWVEENRLQYSAPKGKMTSKLRGELVDRKAEIISFLLQVKQATNTIEMPMKPVERNGNSLALSFAQQRLWFIEKTGLSRNAYNIPLTLHLTGQLDELALQKSLNQLMIRHETLRTTFSEINGTPVQIIRDPFELQLPKQDLSGLTSSQKNSQLKQLLQQENQQQFNLEIDPPIRTQLIKLTVTEHLLQVTFHHIASDGWSLTVFAKELSEFYTAAVNNQPITLPQLPVQYADFAVWQRNWLQGKTLETQLGYWKHKLQEIPLLQLPTDHPRPAVETFRGAGKSINLSASLTSKLEELTQRHGLTLFMTLLAGFKVLLYRYSGQESIAVGSPIANRNRSEIEGLIGFFVNSLVLYTDLQGEPSFTEVLNRVRQTTLEAYGHQDLPLEKLIEELQPERSLSHNPLFQVMFALQQAEAMLPNLSLPNLEVASYQGTETEIMVRMDLEFHLWPEGDELKVWCLYNQDLFESDTIDRMLSHYQVLLSAAVATPEKPINKLSLMTEVELNQILVEWNNTKTDYPADKCIHQLFEAQVEKTPDAVAVIFENQQLTYAQLNTRANQLAHYLQQQGVKPEVLVGICVDRSMEMVVGLLGILKAGAAYVPLDPTYPQQRLVDILEDADIHFLLTDSNSKSCLPQTRIPLICLDQDKEIQTAIPANHSSATDVDSDNLAYVIYTSGSTGKPKGVQISHQSVVNFLTSMNSYLQLSCGDRFSAITTISFDIAALELYLPLIVGASVIVVSREIATDGNRLLPQLLESEVTVIQATPATWQMLIASGLSNHKLVAKLLCGGEALLAQLADQLLKIGSEVWNLYGPTESTIWSSIYKVENTSETTTEEQIVTPIGCPIANTQIYLLNQNQQPVPIGVPGELHIGGVGLARGYLNRQELTQEKFIPHPFSQNPDTRLYKTGDLARYLPDGNIEFLGRIDHQVKIRGFRIETGEIEVTLNQNPVVKESVVLARKDNLGDKRLVAYIVPKIYTNTIVQSELVDTQVSHWEDIFDQQIDSNLSQITDPLFNTEVWVNSYDHQPIPETQMRIWAKDIVSQVLALAPQKVWEIGCGTGMLLFQFAPNIQSYYGTDISNTSLDYIRQQIEREPQKYSHITLAQKQADDMAGVADNSFDVVLLNSIAQYFPSIDYLSEVIENSIRVVKPGGTIVLGDIRSLPLMRAFHTSIQLYKATPSLSLQQLRQQIERQIQQEKELLLSPKLFIAIKNQYPEITHIQIRLERGRESNELNKYRYSVLLHIEVEPTSVIKAPVEKGTGMSIQDIEAYLKDKQPESICFSCLANDRVGNDVQAVELLSRTEEIKNVQQLRQKLQEQPINGINPEQLHEIGASLGYELELCWSAQGNEGCFDAVFVRSELAAEGIVLTPLTEQSLVGSNWHGYGNNPLASQQATQVIPKLKEFLLERLPEYMVPSGFVVLPQLPLTPNGKIDRKALPTPDNRRQENLTYIAPRHPVEKVLVWLWQQLLSIDQIGVEDNFFNLGGHSLKATQMVSRLNQLFPIQWSVNAVFENPTPGSLAIKLLEEKRVLAQMAQIEQLCQKLEASKNLSVADIPNLVAAEGIAGDETLSLKPRLKPGEPSPLSFAQQRLWFIDQMGLVGNAYNSPMNLRLLGELNLKALHQSLNQLIIRHEILRTAIQEVDGQPLQSIQPLQEIPLPVVDLTSLDATKQAHTAQQLLIEENGCLFALDQGLMMRAKLLKLGETEHYLLLTFHHIAFDGWSMEVFARELSALYRGFVAGESSQLPELSIQYADFALWQRNWLQGEVLENQLTYWKQQLAELPLLQLPTDYSRPPVETFSAQGYPFKISTKVRAALELINQKHGTTMFMTLLAAFQVLLYRYSGQERIAVGSPIANRNLSEIEGLCGIFVNTLVLCSGLGGNPTFTELLKRVRQTALGAYAHQDMPFEKLVEELQPVRDMSRNPLFQVMFVFQQQEAIAPKFALTDLEVTQLQLGELTVRSDLELHLWSQGEELQGYCIYKDDLFAPETMERMMGHFQKLLEEIVINPEQTISSLPLLSENELHQLLIEWNDTASAYPSDKCIHQLFEEQVERTPDAVAIIFEQEKLTYRQLNEQANKLAYYLQSKGVGVEMPVGICVERSLEMVVGVLAILKAGGAYVPLDSSYPAQRLAYMLENAAVQVLVTTQSLLGYLPEHQAQVVCLDKDWEKIACYPHQNPVSGVKSENLAYVIYTSGSTGKPKGVIVPHKPAINLIHWVNKTFQVGQNDRLLFVTPLSFDLSVYDIFGILAVGGSIYIASQLERQEPQKLLQLLSEQKITFWDSAPAAFEQIVPFLQFQNSVNTSLRLIFLSGDWIPVTLPDIIKQAFPNAQAIALGGATEATVWSNYYVIEQVPPEWVSIPYGKPIQNAQYYILNESLNPCPIGVVGNLYIGGECLASGYLNNPEKTASSFIENPLPDSQLKKISSKLYKTGDLARYLPDGNMEFLGRVDNQVKIRGFRIELEEIEFVLSTHPQIQRAIVMVWEDNPRDKRLIAYLVSNNSSLSNTELQSYLQQKLPEYMVPSVFVFLDALPLTPNGKLDRKALPAPEEGFTSSSEYLLPQTPTQEIIANIFASVLEVTQVGISDNFFELGGHSLLATQLISRIRQSFKVEISIRTLFESPTVTQLEHSINQLSQTDTTLPTSVIKAVLRDGQSFPLSSAQERLWFLDRLQTGNPTYNIPGAFRITGNLNVSALQFALNEMVRRHEILRTTFSFVNGQPLQNIQPEIDFPLKIKNWQHQPDSQKEAAALEYAQQEARVPFNLATAPLLRVTLLQLTSEKSLLVVILHHIISDGWSLGIFFEELSILYQAYTQGKFSALPAVTIQYVDFTLWQRQWLTEMVVNNQIQYWQNQLADAPFFLQLPTDHVRQPVQTYSGKIQTFTISKEVTEKLQKLSDNYNTTLFMTLLAVFAILLHRYSGQEDILIGSPIANRNRVELESLLGCFLNTIVLRTSLENNLSFAELLSQVREVTLEAYAHQDIPFEQVIEALQPERNLSYSPLFQVMFVLQNIPIKSLQLDDLTWEQLSLETSTSRFDLTLIMEETETGLVANWEYNTDLFDNQTIVRMAGHFQTLLEAVVANPEQKVDRLPLLTAAEEHQLLVEWNNTTTDYPADQCIHQLFEKQVECNPDAVAVVFKEEQLTYRQLNQKANQLAYYLQSLGVQPEVRVGICVERSIEMIVGVLGIFKAGGAYVPLDSSYPVERLAYMLEDAAISVLLTQQSLVSSLPLPDHLTQVVCLDRDWSSIVQQNQENPLNKLISDNLAYMIYTSGSTGRPKGVAVRHQPVVNLIDWVNHTFQVGDKDRLLFITSLSFDLSVYDIFGILGAGGSIHIASESEKADPQELWEILNHKSITFWDSAPAAFEQLVPLLEIDKSASSKLRLVFFSGDWIPLSLANSVKQAFPDAQLISLGGATEATIWSNYYVIEQVNSDWVSIPYGKPIQNAKYFILDKNLQPSPIRIPGMLYIGGKCLASEYANDPVKTAQHFLPDPFTDEPGSRLYKTGDLARYFPDGNIEFLGRTDNQVKIRGFRIELGEIQAILNSYPQIQQTVVICREDTPENKRLVAYFVSEETFLDISNLRQFLQDKLPEYMVPSAFVKLDTIPLTSNGKVDRKALPKPDRELIQTGEFVAPRTPAENTLASIWQDILNIQQVSIHDNFFELGGDSIISIQVVTRAQQAGMKITVQQVLQYQTIAGLAAVSETTIQVFEQQGLVTGEVALTPIQYWFFEQNLPQAHHFNQSFLLKVSPQIKPDLLSMAVGELLSHHDALRLRFFVNDKVWQQINQGLEESIPFEIINLSSVSQDQQKTVLEQAIDEQQQSLNLSQGPLIRVVLFNLGDRTEARLLLIVHHLAIDGISWRILLEDLFTAYQQLEGGEEIQLPPKTTAFQDWSMRLLDYSQSEVMQQELDYWLHHSESKITHLPVDYADEKTNNTVGNTNYVSVKLSVEETIALLQEVPSAYNTQINDVLLTALVQCLTEWIGESSILIDLEGHGREQLFVDVDLSRTVGWFTSLFPVRLQKLANNHPGENLKSIKEQLRAIPNHGIGYGILRYLSTHREIRSQIRATSQAEVSFNYLGQFNHRQSQEGSWQFASESMGFTQSPQGHRLYLLDINALVVEGQLGINWIYSSCIHQRSTIESIAQKYVENLQTLIAHCQSPNTGGYTPSDFSDIELTQDKLDQILTEIDLADI
ncbi:non-ribosomal peptide synthetase [Moorena sp. SIO4G3]|uniref:non-ribosomal peptide synthetase n=1 Tax=Moorena sp. SIO4G3 TaxID=2607821 RepID=UPI00142CEC02|nr:non-ribosomal peptide synthetase [Moorena sp. SIO4G3]NEO77192.1 amino acid adenylation domain-containing protein [Moorena sp. SIO4G3]